MAVTMKRILIVEGNTTESSALIRQHGSRPYAELFTDLLTSIQPGVTCDAIHPADGDVGAIDFAPYDGILWTGSALNAYEEAPRVTRQLALMRDAIASKVPVFGSCWGLQVFAQAMGGRVEREPHWEVPLAQGIVLHDAGRAHPMYTGKPATFDAFAVHMDAVHQAPEGSTILAANDRCAIQALAWETDGARFWGTQYHPEFDLDVMASVLRRLAQRLADDGHFTSADEALAEADRMEQGDAARSPIDPSARVAEIRNWLSSL